MDRWISGFMIGVLLGSGERAGRDKTISFRNWIKSLVNLFFKLPAPRQGVNAGAVTNTAFHILGDSGFENSVGGK